MKGKLLALSLLAATPAQADEAHDLAADLVRLGGSDASMDRSMALIRDKLVAAIAARNTRPAVEIGRAFDELVMPAVRQVMPHLRAETVDLYARTYDLADLRGLDVFYRSPVGRHLLAGAPKIAVAIATEIMPLLQAQVVAAVQAQAARFRQKGIEL